MMLIIRASLLSSYGKNVAKPHYEPKDAQFAKNFYTSLNLRVDLVFWCFPSQSHFGAFTVKFSLNLITGQKIANLQNTVRRLIIIPPSLFFLLIIRASIWSPYGKSLAEPRQDQKDDQFAKYCHTPLSLRFHLVFWCLSSNRHFGTLTLKLLLNPITKEKMTNLRNIVKRLGIIVFRKFFAADHQSDILERSYCEILLNQITTDKIASLETIVTRLRIVVLFYSYSAYH